MALWAFPGGRGPSVGISWLGSCLCPAVGALSLCDVLVFPAPAPTDLSAAKRKFADSLNEFKFRCIGDAETDDEICIGESCCSCSHP